MRTPYQIWAACFDWVLQHSLLRDASKPFYRDRMLERLYLIVKMIQSQTEWQVAIEFDPELPVKVVHLAELIAVAEREGIITTEEWDAAKSMDFKFPPEVERVYLQ